jgi:hypothetical protein
MDLDPSRLRRGELIVGAGAVVLLASMFALKWYAVSPQAPSRLGSPTSWNGWNGLTHVRWLVLLTIACALLLVLLQATRRAPALPVSMSVIVTVLGGLTALVLLYRVVINVPGSDDQKAGAFVGLISAFALAYGGYLSMRREGIGARDAPAAIETVRPAGAGGS